MDTQPQPDLLWLWAKKIKETRSDWDIAWSSQPRKDKKLWVRIAEVGEVTREDKEKLQAVEREEANIFHSGPHRRVIEPQNCKG